VASAAAVCASGFSPRHSSPSSPVIYSIPATIAPPPHAGGGKDVACYYPAVAQKSYGVEKRFLCPPPLVNFPAGCESVPATVSAVVKCHDGETGADHQCSPDDDRKAYFKSLHVTCSSRCKVFSLGVSLDGGKTTQSTSPIAILSKPSKKTLKTASDSIIYSGSLVSFYNRVNSQTVRTKYMGLDQGKLCARNSAWTPLSIHAVREGQILQGEISITFDQEIVLRDEETGFASAVYIVRRVDRTSPVGQCPAPIGHLQKIALELKSATPESPAFLGLSQSTAHFSSSDPVLTHQPATPASAGQMTVDDLCCWSIVGVEKTTLRL